MNEPLRTFTGKQVHPLDLQLRDINIYDIAHSLAYQCRFTGHCRRFYSVAEHSWWVSVRMNPLYALEGLLHDAAETYLKDIAAPLKVKIPEYGKAEEQAMNLIMHRFDLAWAAEDIKKADRDMLCWEWREMMPEPELYAHYEWQSKPRWKLWNCGQAETAFLDRFFELCEERKANAR